MDTIHALHDEVLRRTGGEKGVLHAGAIAAAVARAQRGHLAGETDLATRAAFLLRGIAQDHPFLDGNKRTALEVTDVFLQRNGWRLSASPQEAYDFILRVADAFEEIGLEDIEEWLRRNARKI